MNVFKGLSDAKTLHNGQNFTNQEMNHGGNHFNFRCCDDGEVNSNSLYTRNVHLHVCDWSMQCLQKLNQVGLISMNERAAWSQNWSEHGLKHLSIKHVPKHSLSLKLNLFL